MNRRRQEGRCVASETPWYKSLQLLPCSLSQMIHSRSRWPRHENTQAALHGEALSHCHEPEEIFGLCQQPPEWKPSGKQLFQPPGKPSEDAAPANILTAASRETLNRTPTQVTFGFLTHRNCNIVSVCCLKTLRLGVIYYAAMESSCSCYTGKLNWEIFLCCRMVEST